MLHETWFESKFIQYAHYIVTVWVCMNITKNVIYNTFYYVLFISSYIINLILIILSWGLHYIYLATSEIFLNAFTCTYFQYKYLLHWPVCPASAKITSEDHSWSCGFAVTYIYQIVHPVWAKMQTTNFTWQSSHFPVKILVSSKLYPSENTKMKQQMA